MTITRYNADTKSGKRIRKGSLAHAQRKLFENQEHPETKQALDLIGEMYLVEHKAKAGSSYAPKQPPYAGSILRAQRRQFH